MVNCSQCGSSDGRLVSGPGVLQTWRCSACGHEATYHGHYLSVRPPADFRAKEPIFRLMAIWTAKPTVTQLARVRELAPRLSNVPDSTLLRHAVLRTQFELGRFNESEVRAGDLESKLLALGIQVERVPVPIPPQFAPKS
jgi:hypothetical protein